VFPVTIPLVALPSSPSRLVGQRELQPVLPKVVLPQQKVTPIVLRAALAGATDDAKTIAASAAATPNCRSFPVM